MTRKEDRDIRQQREIIEEKQENQEKQLFLCEKMPGVATAGSISYKFI